MPRRWHRKEEDIPDHHVRMWFAEHEPVYRLLIVLMPLSAGDEDSVRFSMGADGSGTVSAIERGPKTDHLLTPALGQSGLIRFRGSGLRETWPD